MAIPVIKLNLVPAPTLWRERHETLGLAGLAFGLLALAGCLTWWGIQATRIRSAGRKSIDLSNKIKLAAKQELELRKDLATLDITKEMPRWRLAERIYLERGLPWSRITAELERTLVDGVRTKAIARNRGTDGTVELKLRGESRRREDEAEFIENLQKNGLFVQVVLEREAERQGGGIDFELRLPMVPTPPPYEALPTPEERKKAYEAKHGKVKPSAPQRPVVNQPKPEPVIAKEAASPVAESPQPQPPRLLPMRPTRPNRGMGEGRKARDEEENRRRLPVTRGSNKGEDPEGRAGRADVPPRPALNLRERRPR